MRDFIELTGIVLVLFVAFYIFEHADHIERIVVKSMDRIEEAVSPASNTTVIYKSDRLACDGRG